MYPIYDNMVYYPNICIYYHILCIDLMDYMENHHIHISLYMEDFTIDEYIGMSSTISLASDRCVSPRLLAKRTLQRYLAYIQFAWARGS